MSRFHQATQVAGDLLNDGPLSRDVWASVVSRCDQIADGTDPALRAASALIPLIGATTRGEGARTVSAMGLQGEHPEPLTRPERQQLRVIALYVTRAASREADPAAKLLLAGVERSLLTPRPDPGGFEEALRGWSHAVAASTGAMNPAGAVAVSVVHRSLLTTGLEELARHEVTDGVGHERLREAVEASLDEWIRAHEVWQKMVPRQTTSSIDLIDTATSQLQHAARRAGRADLLRGLLATGVGGNLTAALAVTPAEMRDESALVASALVLESRSDLASTVQPRGVPLATEEPVTASAIAVGPAVVFTEDTAPSVESSPASRAGVVEVESVEMGDVEGLAGLARQRDAGQLAEAALAGVGEAAALVGDASREELTRLVRRGEEACGSLAVHALPIVHHFTAKVHPNERHEFVSVASEQLLELAKAWDPPQSKWSTFAYRAVDFTAKSANRHFKQWREVVSDQAVGLASQHRVVGSAPRSVEDQVTDAEERALVESWISRLPDRLRVVAERRLDDMKGPSTLIEIGARIGRSESTVHRLEADAYRLLRGYHAESQAEPTPTAVTLRQLAQALRSSAQSGVSTVEQRKWGPSAAQSRPPAR